MQIDYPFHIDELGRTASTSVDDHVRDMIEQFLFTAPGERVNRPDFGGGLLQKVFEPNSSDLATALLFTVRSGLQRWLDDLIEVRSLEASGDDAELGVVVDYVVRSTRELRRSTLPTGGAP